MGSEKYINIIKLIISICTYHLGIVWPTGATIAYLFIIVMYTWKDIYY